ncbi:MAG: GDSL-type esterase/lipase family protein [Candidatus Omnitrophica bacterium]|jgi:lysophospholipase L1-like esterase|nr:GDSL-type esterase/lipase family protein [Candidatus Omnitrophota bacterium]MDD5079448.1 GDSL-type esterase/lipase family protein [Candidatus Omnitrophota bacterium]
MKKNNRGFILTACSVLCAAAVLICGCARPNIANLDSRGKNIICFGDSITKGHGAGPKADYPSALIQMTSMPVVNAGINSDTTAEALKRVGTDVLSKDPLLVIVEFGGNDFLNKIPFEETIGNMEEIIKAILAKGAMVAIADISGPEVMASYGAAYKELSVKYRTILIPGILSGIFTNPALKSDFVHPNDQGYKIVAHRIYRGIIPYLNQNSILRMASLKDTQGQP